MSVSLKVKQAIAYVRLAKEPVNSMDLKLWTDLDATLTQIKEDTNVRGIIFYSGLKKDIFTAGNDLGELYAPKTSLERYEKFWALSNKVLAGILESPLITLAAVNGNCPAGGCCLALACDYRIASEDVKMGLNETALGIPVPAVWNKLLAYTVGAGKADKLSMFAQMVSAKHALRIGMVDQLVPTRDELLPTAEMILTQMLKIPDLGRSITKRQNRSLLASEWKNDARLKQESAEAFKMLSDKRTVKALDAVFERLSKPKL